MTTVSSNGELQASSEELQEVLPLFKGQVCWNVSSCGIGNSLTLSFGKAIEEVVYTTINSPPERCFVGQYQLTFVCSWRLDDENHNPILSSQWSDYHAIKTTVITLLAGDSVESIEIVPPLWEATVRFSSGIKLKTFCDSIPDGMMNWWCDTEKDTYYIGPGQEICKEKQRLHLVSNTLYDPSEIDPKLIISDKNYKPTEDGVPEDQAEAK
jgi:hypothetical protein